MYVMAFPWGKVYGCLFLKTWPTREQGSISIDPPHIHVRNDISGQKVTYIREDTWHMRGCVCTYQSSPHPIYPSVHHSVPSHEIFCYRLQTIHQQSLVSYGMMVGSLHNTWIILWMTRVLLYGWGHVTSLGSTSRREGVPFEVKAPIKA